MDIQELAIQLKRDYNREYRKKNKEKLKEYRNKWAKQNPDKIREYKAKGWEKKAAELLKAQ